MIFRVDLKNLALLVNTDPTVKMNNSSVWIDGKRRDRVTDRFVWFDELQEAVNALEHAVATERRNLTAQISQLNAKLDSLDTVVTSEVKSVKAVIRDFNNDNWG